MNHSDPTNCRRLPGNTMAEVLVEEKLYVYLKTFEQLAVHRPHLRFRNTARLGARITGMPYATFEEALRWLGSRSAADVDAVVAGRHGAKDRGRLTSEGMVAALQSTRDYLRDMMPRALALAAQCEASPANLLDAAHRDAPEVRALLEAAEALRRDLQARADDYRLLEAGRTRFELFRGRMDLAGVAGLAPHGRRMLADREFAWAIVEGIWFLQCWLQRFLESVDAAPSFVKRD
jgi:hypothetical protein